jgi:hypothetical protein
MMVDLETSLPSISIISSLISFGSSTKVYPLIPKSFSLILVFTGISIIS